MRVRRPPTPRANACVPVREIESRGGRLWFWGSSRVELAFANDARDFPDNFRAVFSGERFRGVYGGESVQILPRVSGDSPQEVGNAHGSQSRRLVSFSFSNKRNRTSSQPIKNPDIRRKCRKRRMTLVTGLLTAKQKVQIAAEIPVRFKAQMNGSALRGRVCVCGDVNESRYESILHH